MNRKSTASIQGNLCALVCSVMVAGCGDTDPANPPVQPKTCFLADLDAEIREMMPRSDGIQHVDTPATIAKLSELHVQTYLFWVGHAKTDWNDLAEFLPEAAKADIDVWVYLAPPSGCSQACSEPFGVDYVQWAHEIATLSLKYPNLKGWSIDDFYDNLFVYNTTYLTQMMDEARAVNPAIGFFPLVNFRSMTATFVDTYAPLVDGMMLEYRDDPYRNTQRSDSMPEQLATAGKLLDPIGEPLYLLIFANALSRTPMPPKPDYVDNVMKIGLQSMSEGRVAGMVTYALVKDAVPAPDTSNFAHGGLGHYTIGLPAGTNTQPSAQGGISQTATVDSAAVVHTLSFWHRDPVIDPADMGAARLELLINGNVAWQEDLAASPVDEWVNTQVNLDMFVAGATSAKITFNLVDGNPIDTKFMLVRLDDITTVGLTLQNEGFEVADGWQFEADHPAVLGAIDFFDKNRAIGIFDVVKDRYGSFKCQ
jgi:hypothetical protein